MGTYCRLGDLAFTISTQPLIVQEGLQFGEIEIMDSSMARKGNMSMNCTLYTLEISLHSVHNNRL